MKQAAETMHVNLKQYQLLHYDDKEDYKLTRAATLLKYSQHSEASISDVA